MPRIIGTLTRSRCGNRSARYAWICLVAYHHHDLRDRTNHQQTVQRYRIRCRAWLNDFHCVKVYGNVYRLWLRVVKDDPVCHGEFLPLNKVAASRLRWRRLSTDRPGEPRLWSPSEYALRPRDRDAVIQPGKDARIPR